MTLQAPRARWQWTSCWLALAVVPACSAEADRPDPWHTPLGPSEPGLLGGGSAGDTAAGAPDIGAAGAPGDSSCEEGEQLACRIVIDQANGVRSCWEGVRTCREGRWGACEEPPATMDALPEPN